MKQNTVERLKNAFIDLIKEKKYENITVKELTEKAKINRKTFYLHYDKLDDLLKELQEEMAQDFIIKIKDYRIPDDLEQITREFYNSCNTDNHFREHLICSESYSQIQQQITDSIMDETWKTSRIENYIKRLIMTFVSKSTLEIYRQWVHDGKKIPVEEMIELTTQLISNGVNSLNLKII